MTAASHTEGDVGAVSLLNAVFCVNCETISNSPHDSCLICGSHSLISLFRVLGGTLRSQKPQSAGDHAETAKYSLELNAKVHEISATGLNLLIELLTRLAEVAGDVELLHLDLAPVIDTPGVLRAA